MRPIWLLLIPLPSLALHFGAVGAAAIDEFEQEPIQYSRSEPANPVSRLQEQLSRDEVRLEYEEGTGYLRSLLKELQIPVESQTLVFSKTSLQRQRISSRTPRALYFNDDVYVGFCQNGGLIEVSAADPRLGTVYYVLEQRKSDSQRFVRETDSCLICHGSSQTQNVPGHLLRSVFADAAGYPIPGSGSHRVDQTTPFEKRWGGWYVTGRHGEQTHLGNLVIQGRTVPQPLDNADGQNVTDLSRRIDVEDYLSPHSDIVALLVLEHQTMTHNAIARANFATRQALHYQEGLNRSLGEPAGHRWDSTTTRIKSAGDALVECLLFSGEAPLTAPVTGTSGFAERFAAAGPCDVRGRSLREFDLQRRTFKYPCSYLIYSESFDALPDEMRTYVWQRLWEVLHGTDDSDDFTHLTAEDRAAIVQIVRETKTGLPAPWATNEP